MPNNVRVSSRVVVLLLTDETTEMEVSRTRRGGPGAVEG